MKLRALIIALVTVFATSAMAQQQVISCELQQATTAASLMAADPVYGPVAADLFNYVVSQEKLYTLTQNAVTALMKWGFAYQSCVTNVGAEYEGKVITEEECGQFKSGVEAAISNKETGLNAAQTAAALGFFQKMANNKKVVELGQENIWYILQQGAQVVSCKMQDGNVQN